MLPPLPHRKLVRHYDLPGHAHELTFSCYKRWPLLDDDRRRVLLSRALDAATDRHRFRLLAFVYMPEHVHLIVSPRVEHASVADLLFAIKRPFSFRVKTLLEADGDPLLQRLTINERPGKQTFRFWQEGPGYDRNLTSWPSILDAADYAHNNPVRRGLCDRPADYKWSSWRHYYEPEAPHDPDLPTVHGMPP